MVHESDEWEIDLSGIITSVAVSPAEFLLSDQYIAIALQGNVLDSLAYLLENAKTRLETLDPALVVLNFSYLNLDVFKSGNKDAIASSIAALNEVKKTCAEMEKWLVLMYCPKELETALRPIWGDEDCFFSSLSHVLSSLRGMVIEIKGELHLFEAAVVEVFQAQFSLPVKSLGPRRLESDATWPIEVEIIGMMPLNSEHLRGNVALCFPAKILCQLGEKQFGSKLQSTDPLIPEMAAELANMILGWAKQELNKKGYAIEQVLPQTITGKDGGVVKANLLRPSWYMEFSTELGNFFLEVSLMEKE